MVGHLAFNASLNTMADVCVNILSGRVVDSRRGDYLSCAFFNLLAIGRGVFKLTNLLVAASPIEVTQLWMEAPQARWSCASSLKTFTQSFLHRA